MLFLKVCLLFYVFIFLVIDGDVGAVPLAGVKNKDQAISNCKAIGWLLSQDEVDELEKHSMDGSYNSIWKHG